MTLTVEQQAIVDAPDGPFAVTACAGSGKTRTAVHRLAELRRRMGTARGRPVLLSFTNVAVDTFRHEYRALSQRFPRDVRQDNVEINTFDGFLCSHVLRSHGHRTMGATRIPYLVKGTEPFLTNFSFRVGNIPKPIVELAAVYEAGDFRFEHRPFGSGLPVDSSVALPKVLGLGRHGGYTHGLTPYWAFRVLAEQPGILRAICRRYPRILIDEAQDFGPCHQALLELLANSGCELSLIGDANQGIYAFNGADGSFLTTYAERTGGRSYELTVNHRSVPAILNVANNLSGRQDSSAVTPSSDGERAWFMGYETAALNQLLDAFTVSIANLGLKIDQSAVICRASDLAGRLNGSRSEMGQGQVQQLALAAVLRDHHGRFEDAFALVAAAVANLLEGTPRDFLVQVRDTSRAAGMREVRRAIWQFTRNPEHGLPSAHLIANAQWHANLVRSMTRLLDSVGRALSCAVRERLGQRLARTGLPGTPLLPGPDIGAQAAPRIRCDTVHKSKGESLDAVLYVTTREHANAMLNGVDSEVGRIGYVAVTRARRLLWVAVPQNALGGLRSRLVAAGLEERR